MGMIERISSGGVRIWTDGFLQDFDWGGKIEVEAVDAGSAMFQIADDSGRRAKIFGRVVASFHVGGRAMLIQVGDGFVTDFASVPRLLQAWIPKTGRHNWAAIVHDALYSVRFTPRKAADRIFYALMRHGGVSAARARVMYWGVRVGGGYR